MTAPRAVKQCNSCGEKKDRSEFPHPRSVKCADCYVSRVCITCGERKPVEEFPVASNRKSVKGGVNRRRKCHPCYNAAKRKSYGEVGRQQRFKWQYGITHEQWEAMFDAQGRACANPGCRTTEPGGSGWCTDHDHACCPQKSRSCGECIRGILCFKCNVMLGCANDRIEALLGGAEYISQFQSTVSTRRAI